MLSRAPKLINQTAHHTPPSRLTLLGSSISLHTRGSPSLALHSPPQIVVPLFLLCAPHKPRRKSPPRRPRQNLPPVRKPNDPTDTGCDCRSRQLRKSKLHWEEV